MEAVVVRRQRSRDVLEALPELPRALAESVLSPLASAGAVRIGPCVATALSNGINMFP